MSANGTHPWQGACQKLRDAHQVLVDFDQQNGDAIQLIGYSAQAAAGAPQRFAAI